MNFLQQRFTGINDWWRYCVGVLVTLLFYFIGQIPLTLVTLYAMNKNESIGTDQLENFETTMDFSLLGISSNLGFLLLIVIFIFAMLGLYLTVTLFHKKKFNDIITAAPKIRIERIVFGFVVWTGLGLFFEIVLYMMNPESYTYQLEWHTFLPLLLICVTLLPIQTSFEELFFRGYIMQGLGFINNKPLFAILGSSLLFGLMHMMNPEVVKYGVWTMLTYYVFAGAIMALITVLDNGLELALGMHASTNIISAAFLTYDGSVLQTESMFSVNELNPLLLLFVMMLSSLVFVFICTKKYKWGDLLGKLV